MKAIKPLLIKTAKFLLKLALDQAVYKALPLIYNKLDSEMPTMLTNYGPKTVQSQMQTIAMEAVGKRVSPVEIEAIAGLYSPIAAAARNIRRE